MGTKEKMYIFRENGKLYIARESVYLRYQALKHYRIRCIGFNTATEVIKFLCSESNCNDDDFIIVI